MKRMEKEWDKKERISKEEDENGKRGRAMKRMIKKYDEKVKV